MIKKAVIFLLFSISVINGANDVTRPRILGVAHMAFYVSDLQNSLHFYKDYLGFGVLAGSDNQIENKEEALIKINDDQYIKLSPRQSAQDGMLNNIAFYTDDIEGMKSYLIDRGVEITRAITLANDGNRIFELTDPDGHTIQFIEYQPDSRTTRFNGEFMPETSVAARISHIGITTSDEDRARAFYVNILEFNNTNKPQVPEGTEKIEFGMHRKTPTAEFRGSRNHVCLIAKPGVEKVMTILNERNHDIPIEAHILRKVNWHANVYDPDGTRVEFTDAQ